MRIGACLLLVILACLSGSAPAAAEPDRPTAPEPIRFELPGRGARTYATDAPATELDLELAAELARRFPRLRYSPRLARAAEVFAAIVPPAEANTLPVPFVEAVLHWAGSPHLSPKVTLVYTSGSSTVDLWSELEQRLQTDPPPATAEIGIGRARGNSRPFTWRWAAVVAERKVDLDPFPRTAALGEAPTLDFRLADGLDNPEIVVTSSSGRVSRRPAERNGAGWAATVQLGIDPGSQRVEIIATGYRGPQVAALFPVWIGVSPPQVWEGARAADETWIQEPEQAEGLLLDLLNDERRCHGLPPLVADSRLAEVARRHSQDMLDRGYFAHLSPEGAGLPDRLRAAGIQTRHSAENLARSPSVAEAHASLMRSPAHAANILTTEMDRVGIGVAFGRGEDGRPMVLVTEVFARSPLGSGP